MKRLAVWLYRHLIFFLFSTKGFHSFWFFFFSRHFSYFIIVNDSTWIEIAIFIETSKERNTQIGESIF